MAKEQPQGLALRRKLERLQLELSSIKLGEFLDMVLERKFMIKQKQMVRFLIKVIFFFLKF